MIKAIETQYKGYRFRSRLEARWAVFFDALGIKWEYEPEGFEYQEENETFRYLPDFYLPELSAWAEIKPDTPDDYNRRKHLAFVLNEQSNLFINLVGTPEPFKAKNYISWSAGTGLMPIRDFGDKAPCWLLTCKSVSFAYDHVNNQKCLLLITNKGSLKKESDGQTKKGEAGRREWTVFWRGSRDWEMTDFEPNVWMYGLLDYKFGDNVSRACSVARSARFEHGESPFIK